MNTTITKVASVDILSSAMEEIYNKQLKKRAEENYYASAVGKLEDAASRGYSVAQDILNAMNGKYPHGQKSFDVTDPMLGLSQQEAYAIAGDLQDPNNAKGTHMQEYDVSRSTGAHGDDLLRAMRDEAEKGSAEKSAKDVTPGSEEIAAIENDGIRPVKITPGVGSPVPGPVPGNSSEPTEKTDEEYVEEAYRNVGREHPAPPETATGFHKKESLHLLNVIEKVANVLGENGFEMSEVVADQLLQTFIKESR